MAAFGLLTVMSGCGVEAENISDFKGLNSRSPWLAFMMLLVMFSLAGIPPLVGFMAKLLVLEALIEVHLVWLAAVALILAVVGSYYYIRVVKVMYFEEPEEETHFNLSKDVNAVLSLNSVSLLLLGLFPTVLFTLCEAATLF